MYSTTQMQVDAHELKVQGTLSLGFELHNTSEYSYGYSFDKYSC